MWDGCCLVACMGAGCSFSHGSRAAPHLIFIITPHFCAVITSIFPTSIALLRRPPGPPTIIAVQQLPYNPSVITVKLERPIVNGGRGEKHCCCGWRRMVPAPVPCPGC